MKKVKAYFYAVIGVLALMCGLQLQGCASFGENPATEKLVVQYATMKVIEADKNNMPARAAKINSIVISLQSLFKNDATTIAMLRAEVQMRLPNDMSPADWMLATALIDAVVAELETRVGVGVLSADKKLAVGEVLSWISATTAFYEPKGV